MDPNGAASQWIGSGESNGGFFPSGVRYQQTYDKFHWDNGDSRLLVTVSRGTSFAIPHGEWQIEVEAVKVQSEGILHAWLERDSTRPIRFTNHLWEEFTLSIPGTARTVIAVASVSSRFPLKVAPYSSFGPTRDNREKPDIAAPGESIEAAKSGTTDGICCMSGTSMAAPHVTGAIALLLSHREKQMRTNPAARMRQFNAAQIRAALCQSTQNYTGRPDSSMGYGVLDVRRLFDSITCDLALRTRRS
jgi:endonuclease G